MSTLKVTNVQHETSTLNTLVFDNGGGSGNGRVTTKGTIGEITAVSYASTITLDFRTGNNFSTTLTGNTTITGALLPGASDAHAELQQALSGLRPGLTRLISPATAQL